MLNSAADASLLILTLNEAGNIGAVISSCVAEFQRLGIRYEVVIADGGSTDGTIEIARSLGASVIKQKVPGYGAAFVEGFSACKGEYVFAFDADCSHPAQLVEPMWRSRANAAIVVGSRYIEGGGSAAPAFRRYLSTALNFFLRLTLALPISDATSGLRLYRRTAIRILDAQSRDFDILVEILTLALIDGHALTEVPLKYLPRRSGTSHARILRLGSRYLSTVMRLRPQRISAQSADYDNRAYNSFNLIQRFWQRRRFSIVCSMIPQELKDRGSGILDIGCGSSKIAQYFGSAVVVDVSLRKLRFLSNSNHRRACASTFSLPFADGSFQALIHSQVIEHIACDDRVFTEIVRVLKPGGILVIGTPDYGRPWWPIIEFFYGLLMPHAYADEHISHYTFESLSSILGKFGFEILGHRYILGGELIVLASLTGRQIPWR